MQSTICQFIDSKLSVTYSSNGEEKLQLESALPFKDKISANAVRRQLGDLSRKKNISPVFTSRKIKDEIRAREDKRPLVNQQCVECCLKCDLRDADYVGYTCRNLN